MGDKQFDLARKAMRKFANNTKNIYKRKIKLADTWFSRRTRLEHCDEHRRAKCVSCNKIEDVKDMDCGHYYNRNNKSTRWYEKNARPQCAVRKFGCNSKMDRPEVQHAFRESLVKDGVDMLKLEIKKNNTWKPSLWEIDYIIEENKAIVREILKQKGVQKWW